MLGGGIVAGAVGLIGGDPGIGIGIGKSKLLMQVVAQLAPATGDARVPL